MGCHFLLQGNFRIQGLTPLLVSSALHMDSLPMHYKWSEFTQSCPTLCDPMDYSSPSSSIHGIFQARVLEWVAISFSRGSPWPRDWTWISCIAGRLFTIWATREAYKGKWKSPPDNIKHSWCCKWTEIAQSCPALWDPMDCSLPGSSVHGIFQAVVLEWIAISFSRVSSQARDRTQVSRIVDRHFTVWATREESDISNTAGKVQICLATLEKYLARSIQVGHMHT